MSTPQTPPNCPGPDDCAPVRSSSHGWHFKKEIQLGHMITTASIIASVAIFVMKMEQRLAIAETQIAVQAAAQRDRDAKQDIEDVRLSQSIEKRLDKVENKLDTLIDRLATQSGRR